MTLSSPAHKIADNRDVKNSSADVTRQETGQKISKLQAESTGERSLSVFVLLSESV